MLLTFDRLYKEAKQAYTQCLKIDPKSLNVMKDLSSIQLTLKDWAGLQDTRRKYMMEQPHIINWSSFLFALYMCGDYDTAFEAVESMLQLLTADAELNVSLKYQISELHLFSAHMHHK